VGRKFDSIEWRVVRITDDPIGTIDDAEELPAGEIGELIVRGPQVSRAYVTRQEANALAKIADWHRTGDVGYLDDAGRFWYCGRKSQRVESANGPLYTECVEAVANRDPEIRRCALVGVGLRRQQAPVLVFERTGNRVNRGGHSLLDSLQSQVSTRFVQAVFDYGRLPVDIRHNAKINRELLAQWAAKRIRPTAATQSGEVRSHAERGSEG
jgi:acyl-CoA synthetase (AMP-forming)/AMP-acid ligase II